MTKFINRYTFILLLILTFLSRLPQLLSENLILDGDEAIVGLMTNQFLSGDGIPFFFYGQSYGFSFIEMLFISPFYGVFGMTDIAVKLGMLLLFVVGVYYLFRTFKSYDDSKYQLVSWMLILFFILNPAFAVWAMKARGGYLTAFVLCSILIYLFTKKSELSTVQKTLVGIIPIIIFQAQPLFLAGLIPLILVYCIRNSSVKNWTYWSAGALASMFIFLAIKWNSSNYWSPEILDFENFEWSNLSQLPKQSLIHLSGWYTYELKLESSNTSFYFAALTLIILLFSPLFLVFKMVQNKKIDGITLALILGLGFYFALFPFLKRESFRYLLPVSLFGILLLANTLQYIPLKKWYLFPSFLLLLLGIKSMHSFKHYRIGDKSAFVATAKDMQEKEIYHVFSYDPMQQWQLMFYSKGKIITRYKSIEDRIPAYVEEVNKAYFDPNQNTAFFIGYNPIVFGPDSKWIGIEESLMYLPNPPMKDLIYYEFEF